jgi:hypothetical protein
MPRDEAIMTESQSNRPPSESVNRWFNPFQGGYTPVAKNAGMAANSERLPKAPPGRSGETRFGSSKPASPTPPRQ